MIRKHKFSTGHRKEWNKNNYKNGVMRRRHNRAIERSFRQTKRQDIEEERS